MSRLLDDDRCRVPRLGGHAIEGQAKGIVGVVHSHPSLERPADVLEAPLELPSRGLQLRESVERRQRQGIIAGVGDGRLAHQRGKVLLRQGVVHHRRHDSVDVVLLGNLHLVRAHVHGARGLDIVLALHAGNLGIAGCERLDQEAAPGLALASSPGPLQEGAKSDVRRGLVGLVGAAELEEGIVLRSQSEGGDALSAVDVEGPDGLAEDSRDAGEEVGDGGADVVIVEDVAASIIE
mmetsp:Transcript_32223/g.77965  ORF Transcript_32223/g.77965 Transcript_32223/m.77965 type:complete len:236 (-) Transcript_32223:463-1170(-)